eukprot:9752364-Heterocapsa_arctica.AAC.1
MHIPCWAGVWFWDDLEQFTTPNSRQHHGQRTGLDFKGTRECLAPSWHWDRLIFLIVSFLTANTFDCQTRLGWIQLYGELTAEERTSEVLMDS